MSQKNSLTKGMRDILSAELANMEYVESLFVQSARNYGFLRVQTPILEPSEVYSSTSKFPLARCYTLTDGGERQLVVRSDPDAPMARLVANHLINSPKPIKLMCSGSILRPWNPHRREFRMFSLSTFGVPEPTADAEILRVLVDVIERVGFTEHRIEYNNLALFESLITAGMGSLDTAGDVLHAIRFAETPQAMDTVMESYGLSVPVIDAIHTLLDSNGDEIRTASVVQDIGELFPQIQPAIQNTLAFKAALDSYGLPSRWNLARLHGTGFYSGLTYRLFPPSGSKEIGDGGRYDHMMDALSGKTLPATGIGLGIERFVDLMEMHGLVLPQPTETSGLLVAFEDNSIAPLCRGVFRAVRSAGHVLEESFTQRRHSRLVSYAQSKNYTHLVKISASESAGWLHLRIVRVDNDDVRSVSVADENELSTVLLECYN